MENSRILIFWIHFKLQQMHLKLDSRITDLNYWDRCIYCSQGWAKLKKNYSNHDYECLKKSVIRIRIRILPSLKGFESNLESNHKPRIDKIRYLNPPDQKMIRIRIRIRTLFVDLTWNLYFRTNYQATHATVDQKIDPETTRSIF